MSDNTDVDVLGHTPDLAISLDRRNVSILCRVIEPGPFAASGKTIRLRMTAADAMRLLFLLKSARQELGLPEYDGPLTMTTVPPAKDRS